jgi:hypothetical protein
LLSEHHNYSSAAAPAQSRTAAFFEIWVVAAWAKSAGHARPQMFCCVVFCAPQDVNKEPGAEETFKKIGEAYEVRGETCLGFKN